MGFLILAVKQVTLSEKTNSAKKRWKFTRSGPQPAVPVPVPSPPTYPQPTYPTYPTSTVTPVVTSIPTADADTSQGNTGSNPNRPRFNSETLEISNSDITNVGRDQYHVINTYYVDPNFIPSA